MLVSVSYGVLWFLGCKPCFYCTVLISLLAIMLLFVGSLCSLWLASVVVSFRLSVIIVYHVLDIFAIGNISKVRYVIFLFFSAIYLNLGIKQNKIKFGRDSDYYF